MAPTAQDLKLSAGLAEIRGLVKPHLAADEKLVGADDDSSIAAHRNLTRFRLGKSERAFRRIAPLYAAGFFEDSFVEPSRFDPEIDAGGGEQPRPHGTARSEDQILSHSCHAGGTAIS